MLNDPNEFRANSYLAQPGCRVTHGSGQTVTTNVRLFLDFTSITSDPFAMVSSASSITRITFGVLGVYLFGASIAFPINATGERQISIRLNGSTFLVIESQAASGTVDSLAISTRRDFVNGDYIEVGAFQKSGGNLDVNSTSDYTPIFWAQRVG